MKNFTTPAMLILVVTSTLFLMGCEPPLKSAVQAPPSTNSQSGEIIPTLDNMKVTHYTQEGIYKVSTDDGIQCMVLENYPYGGIDCSFPSENNTSKH